jgi:bifunctional DNA-binding transcriptional regulator/antitoxin component of YhaV-PrlF toxin-antitoxin module
MEEILLNFGMKRQIFETGKDEAKLNEDEMNEPGSERIVFLPKEPHPKGVRNNIFGMRCKMVTVQVSSDFTVKIPVEFRSRLRAGQEVAVGLDAQGRLIITPIEQIDNLLQETFGMWADRTDIPMDGVETMDQIRRGRRLDEFGLREK